MKQRSKQQNPEQKNRNGINNQDVEFSQSQDIIKQAKKAYENRGAQPTRSKIHPK